MKLETDIRVGFVVGSLGSIESVLHTGRIRGLSRVYAKYAPVRNLRLTSEANVDNTRQEAKAHQ